MRFGGRTTLKKLWSLDGEDFQPDIIQLLGVVLYLKNAHPLQLPPVFPDSEVCPEIEKADSVSPMLSLLSAASFSAVLF